MKVIRCVLAIAAVAGCVTLVKNDRTVHAQQCCVPDSCGAPPACPTPQCSQYPGTCDFYWICNSPIIVDVEDKGFHLTDQAHGVYFQFYGNQKQHVAWTDPKYGNAWLALDRNGNGVIDDATELFGNDTPQPPSPNANGFVRSDISGQRTVGECGASVDVSHLNVTNLRSLKSGIMSRCWPKYWVIAKPAAWQASVTRRGSWGLRG